MKIMRLLACAACAAAMTTVAFAESGVYVNDIKVSDAVIEKRDEKTMIPLRAVCEELGFEVRWIEESNTVEIVKLPVYITCSLDQDGYTFSKMAPQPLGSAPVLINDKTYVPINFLTDILNARYTLNDDEELRVYYGDYARTVTVLSKDDNKILVQDRVLGEVLLNISDETVFNNDAEEVIDEKTAMADIKDGSRLIVTYSDAMTRSIPPQTNATYIKVLSDKKRVTVKSKEPNGILVQDTDIGEVLLMIGEDTPVTDADGKAISADDIKENSELLVEYSNAMTMSLPPHVKAVSVQLINAE